MQITIDLDHPKAGEHIQHLVEFYHKRSGVQHIANGPAALLHAADNPAAGAQLAHNPADVAAAFGGAGVGAAPNVAHSTVGAAVQQIAPGTLMQGANVQQMPVQNLPQQVGANVGISPQGATITNLAPNGIETDKHGLPWDARIHSSNKKKSANGEWAKRKNLPDGLYEQVSNELRATLAGAQVPVGAAQQPMAMQHDPFLAGMQQPQRFAQQHNPVGFQMPAVQQQPQFDFAMMSQQIAQLQGSGQLTLLELQEIVTNHGVTAYHMLQHRPDLWLPVWNSVCALASTRQPIQ